MTRELIRTIQPPACPWLSVADTFDKDVREVNTIKGILAKPGSKNRFGGVGGWELGFCPHPHHHQKKIMRLNKCNYNHSWNVLIHLRMDGKIFMCHVINYVTCGPSQQCVTKHMVGVNCQYMCSRCIVFESYQESLSCFRGTTINWICRTISEAKFSTYITWEFHMIHFGDPTPQNLTKLYTGL